MTTPTHLYGHYASLRTVADGAAIYAFENMKDGKLYIGSSVSARRRVQNHLYLLRLGKHRNQYFQRAYDKHGSDSFRVFILEELPGYDPQELLKVEQRWISAFATTDPAYGYNIHPTPISSDYFPPAAAQIRLQQSFVGRGRGKLTEAGRIAKVRANQLAWQRPGEKEYRAETMRDIWATPEHRDKINTSIITRNITDPEKLAAMRARMAANRLMSEAARSAGIVNAWWKRHASNEFASNEVMNDWIVKQYNNGMSAHQIGLVLGMAHSAVTLRLRKRGVALPKRGAGRAKPALSAAYLARKGINDLHEFDCQVAVLRTEGNSINAIRKVYGLSADAIRNSLQRTQRRDDAA